jgi:Flp pilus assembly protein TadG
VRRPAGDGGAAVVEFLMVSVLLIALLMAVVQVGLYLHVRNVVAASAAEGARYGADFGRNPAAAGPKADEVIGQALSSHTADGIACTGQPAGGAGGSVLVTVRCRGSVPLVFSWLGSLPGLDVTARALKEGP